MRVHRPALICHRIFQNGKELSTMARQACVHLSPAVQISRHRSRSGDSAVLASQYVNEHPKTGVKHLCRPCPWNNRVKVLLEEIARNPLDTCPERLTTTSQDCGNRRKEFKLSDLGGHGSKAAAESAYLRSVPECATAWTWTYSHSI